MQPFICKVSVEETNSQSGQIVVHWVKPDIMVFDTLKFPGPYKTEVLRAESSNPAVFQILPQSMLSFSDFKNQDTFRFIDNSLNTLDKRYIYKAELLTKNNDRFESKPASSMFLKAQGGNRKIILNADVNVPWSNTKFDFYTSDSFDGVFIYAGSNSVPVFTVSGLENKNYYYYKMKSTGSYPAYQKSIENFSQIAVGFPDDNQKPCAPVLNVKNECDEDFIFIPENDLVNYLSWNDPSVVCDSAEDVISYRIYYSDGIDSVFKLLYTINDRNVLIRPTFHLTLQVVILLHRSMKAEMKANQVKLFVPKIVLHIYFPIHLLQMVIRRMIFSSQSTEDISIVSN